MTVWVMSSSQHFLEKEALMVAKAENGHVNIWELFKFNFIGTYNIRSPEKHSEKNMVCAKKVTTLPHLTVFFTYWA
jgi:hypothetical protein